VQKRPLHRGKPGGGNNRAEHYCVPLLSFSIFSLSIQAQRVIFHPACAVRHNPGYFPRSLILAAPEAP
jgi:hypothetical protein